MAADPGLARRNTAPTPVAGRCTSRRPDLMAAGWEEPFREMSALPGGLSEPTTGHVPRRPPTRNESMDPEPWPRRPRPETTGPHFECEITQLAELHTVRVRLRTWVPSILGTSDAGASILDEVLLVADELTTNGLRHGGAPVQVRAFRTAEGLLLDISDGDPHHGPEPAVGRDPALGGMGLHIVAHVTIDRGWSVAGDRKHVWAHLPTD